MATTKRIAAGIITNSGIKSEKEIFIPGWTKFDGSDSKAFCQLKAF